MTSTAAATPGLPLQMHQHGEQVPGHFVHGVVGAASSRGDDCGRSHRPARRAVLVANTCARAFAVVALLIAWRSARQTWSTSSATGSSR